MQKKPPETLVFADGRSQSLSHTIQVNVLIREHYETITAHVVTALDPAPLILGMSWLAEHDPDISWRSRTINFPFDTHCSKHRVATEARHAIQAVSLHAVPIAESDEAASALHLIPDDYKEYLDVFSKASARTLPPHRPGVDHVIKFIDPNKLPVSRLYGRSQEELAAEKAFLEEFEPIGFVRPSDSPVASSSMFAHSPGRPPRLVIDYRAINSNTVKDVYPLPLIDDTLRLVSGATYFTRLDLRTAYYLLRMAEGEEWKTAFRTRYGLYEFLVLPLGLTNAPASMQRYINSCLLPLLDVCCSAYIDDILVWSHGSLSDHIQKVKKVLECLRSAGLFLKAEKCEFHVSRTLFLGFILTTHGLEMDPKKVSAIETWPEPIGLSRPPAPPHVILKRVQQFLGFANYYRRFVRGYSRVARPLFDYLKTDADMAWSTQAQQAFNELRKAFAAFPCVRHFCPGLTTILEPDASDLVVSAVLSQYFQDKDNETRLHPVAFRSRTMSAAEQNYGIGEKELLAIHDAFMDWAPWLTGHHTHVRVLSDHANLVGFTEKAKLNRRQARWSIDFQIFDFKIEHRPGSANGKADALSRISAPDADPKVPNFAAILPADSLLLNDGPCATEPTSSPVSCMPMSITDAVVPQQQYRQALAQDELVQEVISLLRPSGPRRHKTIDLSFCHYDMEAEELRYDERLWIPESEPLRAKVIRHCHDTPTAGHPGREATFEMVTRRYWWPGLRDDLTRYIANCDVCQRAKTPRHKPYGHLRPLQLPHRRWDSISMDFLTNLPEVDGRNAVLVVVDRLSKMAHFIPLRFGPNEEPAPAAPLPSATTEEIARLLLEHVFKLHGLPHEIISDRDPRFTSAIARAWCHLAGIQQSMSTANHPPTDGQSERLIQILEQYLRAYVSYQQNDWLTLLPLAEFSYNNTLSATLKMTPFFANYGFHPRTHFEEAPGSRASPSELASEASALQRLEKHLRLEMLYAQDIQRHYADRRRTPAPLFAPGDQVWLSARHIRTMRPSQKMDWKRLGRFRVLERIGSHAYRLDLPRTMKVHPVFHVSLLEPCASNPMPGQVQASNPPPIVAHDDGSQPPEWEVLQVLDSRYYYRRLQYLVQWVGYDHPTWQPAGDLENAPTMVQEFHANHPDKAGPALARPRQQTAT